MLRAVVLEPTLLSELDFEIRRVCQFRHARIDFARVIGVKERVYTALAHKIRMRLAVVEFIEVLASRIRELKVI